MLNLDVDGRDGRSHSDVAEAGRLRPLSGFGAIREAATCFATGRLQRPSTIRARQLVDAWEIGLARSSRNWVIADADESPTPEGAENHALTRQGRSRRGEYIAKASRVNGLIISYRRRRTSSSRSHGPTHSPGPRHRSSRQLATGQEFRGSVTTQSRTDRIIDSIVVAGDFGEMARKIPTSSRWIFG